MDQNGLNLYWKGIRSVCGPKHNHFIVELGIPPPLLRKSILPKNKLQIWWVPPPPFYRKNGRGRSNWQAPKQLQQKQSSLFGNRSDKSIKDFQFKYLLPSAGCLILDTLIFRTMMWSAVQMSSLFWLQHKTSLGEEKNRRRQNKNFLIHWYLILFFLEYPHNQCPSQMRKRSVVVVNFSGNNI